MRDSPRDDAPTGGNGRIAEPAGGGSASAVTPAPLINRARGNWVSPELLVVDGTEFFVTSDRERYLNDSSTATRFIVAKTPAMVDRMAAAIAEIAPARIVELGIFKGGSAALLASLARPEQLSAIEIAPAPVAALEEFIVARGLGGIVSPHYGVDQGDAKLLAALVDEDHGRESLDLVVDDASHYYRETRAAFEVLFARLRPGGLYIIEDWGWAHFPEPMWQTGGGWFHDRPALTNLVIEILMVAATGEDLVSRVTVLRDTVTVERGPVELDGTLRLENHYRNRGLPFRPLL
jgi:predicted O-methyltransferase YrrM